MVNKREEILVFLLTFSMVTGEVDFSEPFFTVIGLAILNLAISFILYILLTKPLYNWVVRNEYL